jgi:hypothetical protein
MASKKALKERLEQIKARASEENGRAKDKGPSGYTLAEEAAELGLEALEK